MIVGYKSLDDPDVYSIWVKTAILQETPEVLAVLDTWGKKYGPGKGSSETDEETSTEEMDDDEDQIMFDIVEEI
jgi:hypothetical protein